MEEDTTIVVPIKKVEDNVSLKKFMPTMIPIGTDIYRKGANKLAGANFKL